MNPTQQISSTHKKQFLQLIDKQKQACAKRFEEKQEEDALLRAFLNRPIRKPTKLSAEESTTMQDEDFLLAELNGQFQ